MFGIGPSELLILIAIALFFIGLIALGVAAALKILFPKRRD
jgi:hypothetical protein